MRFAPFVLAPRVLVLAGFALLGGCGGGSLLHHGVPDEFAVQRETPLIVPPDFSLAPPKEGEPRPTTDANLQKNTLDALFGGPAPRSDVEKDTISRAGDSAPGIRSNVGDAKTYSVSKGSVTRDILAAPQGDGREAQTGTGG
jgi:hypothetical protein